MIHLNSELAALQRSILHKEKGRKCVWMIVLWMPGVYRDSCQLSASVFWNWRLNNPRGKNFNLSVWKLTWKHVLLSAPCFPQKASDPRPCHLRWPWTVVISGCTFNYYLLLDFKFVSVPKSLSGYGTCTLFSCQLLGNLKPTVFLCSIGGLRFRLY